MLLIPSWAALGQVGEGISEFLGWVLAQASPTDPTSALPGWLVGGGVSSVLVYLLWRAEKRLDDAHKRTDASLAEAYRRTDEVSKRLDASEERYRQMVERYADRTFAAVSQLDRLAEALQMLSRQREQP